MEKGIKDGRRLMWKRGGKGVTAVTSLTNLVFSIQPEIFIFQTNKNIQLHISHLNFLN